MARIDRIGPKAGFFFGAKSGGISLFYQKRSDLLFVRSKPGKQKDEKKCVKLKYGCCG